MLTTAQDWTLVWSDEFNGPDIDTSKWSHEVNGDGGGNNELQYYTARTNNSFIENGNLVIQALKENYSGKAYTSARLRTLNKGDWTYGRFEARMKLPYGQGLWPAFWMLPTDWVYGGWAASGEIDIMEIVGHEPNILHGTIHYHGEWPDNWYSGGSYTLPSGDFSDDFHVFAIEWEYGEIRWYVDDILYSTKTSWDTTSGAPFPAPFDERFHLLLNVAVGGNWPGSPNGSTVFPQRMEVDYVRVYSATNSPPPTSTPFYGSPMAVPGTIEAEDYDNGGQGVAYYDTDAGNNGGSYRASEYVDTEACTDTGGGHNVGWTADGEWLKYTVDVAPAGDYTITTRVARGTGGSGAFHIEVDGVDVTGSIAVQDTGGWQNWVSKPATVSLNSGEQVVEIVIESGDININRLEFVLDQAANSPPVFTSDPINKPNATEDSAYSDNIAGLATDVDAGDTLTYSKLSGPAWLNVATNGALTGTPDNADVGPNSWTVQVSDGNGGTDTATLNVTVDNVNDDPVFTSDPIIMPNAVEDSGYSSPIVSTLAGSATDAEDDTLTYSKMSGPSWLNVHSGGLLYGTPGNTDVGLNSWTVQVSDGNGGSGTATLEITVDGLEAPPSLTIQASGSSLEIMWPTSATGFSLYCSSNLTPSAVWAAVTNTPIIQGDEWMVTMPINEALPFFRLQNP